MGIYSCLPTNIKNVDLLNFKFISKLPSENLHHKFIKTILGVGKLTSHWGIISETGRYPLILDIFNWSFQKNMYKLERQNRFF